MIDHHHISKCDEMWTFSRVGAN